MAAHEHFRLVASLDEVPPTIAGLEHWHGRPVGEAFRGAASV